MGLREAFLRRLEEADGLIHVKQGLPAREAYASQALVLSCTPLERLLPGASFTEEALIIRLIVVEAEIAVPVALECGGEGL